LSSYIRCVVPDGIDLAQGASKPRMNVHALCNVEGSVLVGQLLAVLEGSAVSWMTKEFRQGKSCLSSLKHPDNV
jgi:hypothetical protein